MLRIPPVSEWTLVRPAEIDESEMMSRLTERSRMLLEDANVETSDCADCALSSGLKKPA